MENQKKVPLTKTSLDGKVALITGITGQDGSFLAELLLEKGYIVHGIIRRSATFNTQNIEHIFDKLHLHHGDITDTMNVFNIISKVRPCEIYNLCAMSHVKVSHDIENYTFQTNTLGILSILQSVKNLGMEKTCKIYQASTSEIFGNVTDGSVILNEESPQRPVSVYGISKMAAEHLCNMYRDAYGMFVVNSLLFNHESPRRGGTFVTQKIARYVGKANFSKPLQLGNLDATRDWGHSRDYVYGIWLMLQKDKPDNYVLATGETHSVREFVELAFEEIGIKIEWAGPLTKTSLDGKVSGINEVGINSLTGETLVQVNKKYYRDIDIECLIGDASKAKRELGWEPKITFKGLVSEMVRSAKLF
jgi:GDPmannose 4,6-dehydratase